MRVIDYPMPEHGWSDMKTPEDAIGFERFYPELPKNANVTLPSTMEMETYLRLVETGQTKNKRKFTKAQVASFRKIYDPQFQWMKEAKWSCPVNTTKVLIPRDALYYGSENGSFAPGDVITRFRPADLLAFFVDLRGTKHVKGYEKLPLHTIFGSIGLPTQYDIELFRSNDAGTNKMKPFVCGKCGKPHSGGSQISWVRPMQWRGSETAFSPASMSFMMSHEPVRDSLTLLDRHMVPLTALRKVLDNAAEDEGGWSMYEASILGVNKETITVFKSLKRSKIDMVTAAEWAISISAFDFVWGDGMRGSIESLIAKGVKPTVLNNSWVDSLEHIDRRTERPSLLRAVMLLEHDIDPHLLDSMEIPQ